MITYIKEKAEIITKNEQLKLKGGGGEVEAEAKDIIITDVSEG